MSDASPRLLTTPMRVLRTLGDEELIALAREVSTWTPELAMRLDTELAVRVIDALLSRERAALEACDRLLARVVLPAVRPALDAMDERWASRWRSWGDLLVERAGQLDGRDDDLLRRRAHVARILEHVQEHPGVTQSEVSRALKLNKAHVSRLVTALEDAELLQRQPGRDGRERALFVRGSRPAASPALMATSERPAANGEPERQAPRYLLASS